MIEYLIAALRGLTLNPVLTAFLRGLAEAIAMLVLYAAADYALALPDINPMILVVLPTLVRTGEGLVDRIDPAKQRRRNALREEAAAAEITGGAAGSLDPGDVVDPAIDAAVESYNNGDFT